MRVGLFIPCYVDHFYPNVGIATLKLLQDHGCHVEYPVEQTCCGQPMANSGYEYLSIPTYNHFVDIFKSFDYIVAPSGSCTYHVRNHYDVLEQTREVEHIRSKTLDLVEFLHDVLQIKSLESKFPHKVGVHMSCHGLRGLRLASGSERNIKPYSKIEALLKLVGDIELVPVYRADECCGFGGTFAVNESALSVRMGKDRIHDHLENGVEVLTAGDMSCLMHLEGIIKRKKYPIRVAHIAEILYTGEINK